jgi:hypothetical protein
MLYNHIELAVYGSLSRVGADDLLVFFLIVILDPAKFNIAFAFMNNLHTAETSI